MRNDNLPKLDFKATADHLLEEMRNGKPYQQHRPYTNAFIEATEVMASPDSVPACKRHYRKVTAWMIDNWKDQLAIEEKASW